MPVTIQTRVGKGQANLNYNDNVAVQTLLNKFINGGCLGSTQPLAQDGDVGPKTKAAIEKFQRDIMGFKWPDGYIDPGGQSLAALNGPLKWPKNPPPPAEDNNKERDATMSSQWALLCLKHRKTVFTFELLNLDTDRAHRMILSGAGSDDVPDASLKLDQTWMEGSYYEKFHTSSPANFDNFDGTLSLLRPDTSRPDAIHHILSIGFVAKLKLIIVPGPSREAYLTGLCKVEFGNGVRSRPRTYAPYYPP